MDLLGFFHRHPRPSVNVTINENTTITIYEGEPKPDPKSQVATSLIVSQIQINNLKFKGKIMNVQFGQTQKVTATISGLNAALIAVAAGSITNLRAVIDNGVVASVGNIDQTAFTVDVLGVSDGAAKITYTFANSKGDDISFTDDITVSDEAPVDNLALSGVASYSAPVAQ